MSARAEILRALGTGRAAGHAPGDGRLPIIGDPAAVFIARARAAYAETHEIGDAGGVPAAVLAILAGRTTRLHLPKNSPLRDLPWHRAPAVQLDDAPPSGEDVALSAADYAIAETGTLAFCSGGAQPAAWHFLPGTEIVLVRLPRILPALEDVLEAVMDSGMPSTLNLVTGPSRTADIEQTMERGAHGPRALHILLTE